MTDSGTLAARSATIDCDRVVAAIAFIQAQQQPGLATIARHVHLCGAP
ncbi:MAG: hypothetical protein ACFB0E_09300 [Leptolyngbyaceae cyanobacterium]